MPVTVTSRECNSGPIWEDVYRVLLTGYTPFGKHTVNNSWLAATPLNNQLLTLDIPDFEDRLEEDVDMDNPEQSASFFHPPRQIHISSLLLPVTYQGVLELVPPLHARPPVILPALQDPSHPIASPPESGYDLIFHIGLAGRGGLRLERLGHKTGYKMKDSIGEHAPIVTQTSGEQAAIVADADAPNGLGKPHAPGAVEAPASIPGQSKLVRPGPGDVAHVGTTVQEPSRGFDEGYQGMADDFYTGIDVERLVHDLKAMGVQDVYTSMDAGHYVSDYTYYCSLAEAKRTAQNNSKGKHTKVLFMHCPPANQPFSTEQVTNAIEKTIVWVSQTQDS